VGGCGGGVGGPGFGQSRARPSSDLQGCLQHLHEEGVDGSVPNQLEEEEVLQALQPNGPQRRQAQEEFGKPGREQSQRCAGDTSHPLLCFQACIRPQNLPRNALEMSQS